MLIGTPGVNVLDASFSGTGLDINRVEYSVTVLVSSNAILLEPVTRRIKRRG